MAACRPIHYTPKTPSFALKPDASKVAHANSYGGGHLDLECGASQTEFMSHIYIKLDFGTDEEKAQLARHKLDGWKQAFRLDKRLQYKLDRPESAAGEAPAKAEAADKPAPAAKSKDKTKSKSHEAAAEKSARIPSEEPFKSASPKVILQSDPEFEKADQQFEALD